MKSLETPLIITGVSSKVDGSLSIRATTPELTSEEKVAVMELQNQNLIATLTPTEESNPELLKVEKEMDEKKPSERLRAIIFVYWKQKYPAAVSEEFPAFYRKAMEKIIDTYKQQLED